MFVGSATARGSRRVSFFGPPPIFPELSDGSETNAQGAYLYWFDPVAGNGPVAFWTGLSPIAGTVALEVAGAAIRTHFGRHAPIVLHDAAWSDPRFEALPEFRKSRFEGVVSIPLLDPGRVVGMLDVCRSRRVALQPREFSFLLGISVPVGALLSALTARLRRPKN